MKFFEYFLKKVGKKTRKILNKGIKNSRKMQDQNS